MKDFLIVNFETTLADGNMNMNPKFFEEGTDAKERRRIMSQNKQHVVGHLGLSYKNMVTNLQKSRNNNDLYEDGKCVTITNEEIAKYDDLYDYDFYCDIMKLTPETRNIVLFYPMADCAIVKAVNFKTGEIVLSHCGGEYIDRYLPMQTIDALGGNEKDIKVYVSPFAYSLFYQNQNDLVWANNPNVWKDCLKYKDNSVKVNLYKALKDQLIKRKIKEENLFISPYDTTTSTLFFSNARSYSDKKYLGRGGSGIAIVDESHDIDEGPFIKILKRF